jgi:hypothetical protein
MKAFGLPDEVLATLIPFGDDVQPSPTAPCCCTRCIDLAAQLEEQLFLDDCQRSGTSPVRVLLSPHDDVLNPRRVAEIDAFWAHYRSPAEVARREQEFGGGLPPPCLSVD